MDWLSEIVSGKELDSAKRERTKDYVFTTQVEEAQARYESEGWEFDRTLARRRVKLKKKKPADEIFENRVWTMLYKLGFSHMNRDRSFSVDYSQNGRSSSKQIDVLAADNEILLLIERKCANRPGTQSNFKTDIEAIADYRRHVFNQLKQKFPTQKMVCVFATNNYELGDKNKDLLAAKNIKHFDETAIEYYEALGKTLGKAARYQLLGNLFANQEITGMDTRVAAIKGKMGGRTYYSFSIEPSKLLKMSYILHRNSAQPDEVLPTYQRLIKKGRLKDIQKFVNDGGFFPNSIIVNVANESPRFEQAPKKNQPNGSDSRIGILELPKKYRSIYVIDGQHRLYGYADSDHAESDIIPVVAFYDMDNTEQIKMFMDINEKQKAVPQTLRTTLNADLLWDAEDVSDRQKALRSRIAQDLGEIKRSPLYDRVIVGENTKGPHRSITLPFIDNAIDKAGYLGKYQKGSMLQDGLFEYGNIDMSYKRIFNYLIGCLAYVRDASPDEWERSNKEGAVFTVNVGIYALIRICADVLQHLRDSNAIDIRNTEIDDLVENASFYLLPLVNHIEQLDCEQRDSFTKKYGGNATKDCHFKFRKIVHDAHEEFAPEGLSDWIRDNSMQYNEDSISKLTAIEERIANDFEKLLSQEYGTDWLRIGVDKPVFSALNKRASDREFDTGVKQEPWREVTLEECRKVATWSQNWSRLFKIYFERLIGDGKAHNKTDSTEWMSNLSTVRKQLLTTKNYSVSHDQHELICDYYDKLQSLDIMAL